MDEAQKGNYRIEKSGWGTRNERNVGGLDVRGSEEQWRAAKLYILNSCKCMRAGYLWVIAKRYL